MKERIDTIKGEFVDYAGDLHQFIIAAVSIELDPDSSTISVDDYSDPIVKRLGIGYSICAPGDVYDEEIGMKQAIGRARITTTALYSTHLGLINTKMVKALLEQEAEYLKNNPEKYITRYNRDRKNYERSKFINSLKNDLSELELQVMNKLKQNPNFLDNMYECLEYDESTRYNNTNPLDIN